MHVILGVNDHLQPINSLVWIYAMANESKGKPRFSSFKQIEYYTDNLVLQDLTSQQKTVNPYTKT